MRDRYSVKALLAGGSKVIAADDEARRGLESDALFKKYLDKTADGKPSDDA